MNPALITRLKQTEFKYSKDDFEDFGISHFSMIAGKKSDCFQLYEVKDPKQKGFGFNKSLGFGFYQENGIDYITAYNDLDENIPDFLDGGKLTFIFENKTKIEFVFDIHTSDYRMDSHVIEPELIDIFATKKLDKFKVQGPYKSFTGDLTNSFDKMFQNKENNQLTVQYIAFRYLFETRKYKAKENEIASLLH